ncbi:hypothetical protein C4D60_Mb02t12790 [Musa balbisiana]|uniref:RING-type domain-containing protein n=1 Tax=Musa balbisiana TaxID=52838 RepID=A0A4S8ICL1_MUSBA|nr:hypothetical protein C4D60_Mb02t12790 [Musa balbisiana]
MVAIVEPSKLPCDHGSQSSSTSKEKRTCFVLSLPGSRSCSTSLESQLKEEEEEEFCNQSFVDMGFPVGCSELIVPLTLLRVALFLGHLRRLLFLAFDVLPWSDNSSSISRGSRWNPPLQSASATLTIGAALPVVKYEELPEADDGCAVCLCELEHGDEVRRLSNCRHVFHRGCLDRWVEHDQSTCPLCRAPLVPVVMRWASATDSYYDDDDDCFSIDSSLHL